MIGLLVTMSAYLKKQQQHTEAYLARVIILNVQMG